MAYYVVAGAANIILRTCTMSPVKPGLDMTVLLSYTKPNNPGPDQWDHDAGDKLAQLTLGFSEEL